MNSPNDATINIPMSTVDTRHRDGTVGARQDYLGSGDGSAGQSMNEKGGFRHENHVAGRRKTPNRTRRGSQEQGNGSEEAVKNSLGIIYDKVLNFSIVTRYFLYVLPLAIIISIPIIIGATAAPHASLGGVRIVWIFAWLLIVWLSLWVSKLLSKCLPGLFQFLCGIVSSGTRKYALVLRNLEIYLSLCGWALTSLATFVPVMTRNPTQRAEQETYQKYNNSTIPSQKANALMYKDATGVKEWEAVVQRILAALLVASLILLVEKLFIQLISIGYHRTQFIERIRESKHKIYLLSLLYEASRQAFPAYCPEFAEEDYIINDSLELGDAIKCGGHSRSGSATPLRVLQNVGRIGDRLTSAFGNIASEVTGKQVFNPTSAHSIVVQALERNKSSEALAKRIWMSFVVEGEEALFREDLVEVLGMDHRDEADESFEILDCDGNGDVSLDEMIMTVCEFGKERHSIANSLHDVDQAINVLDKMLCAIVFIVVIFVFVAFLNSSFTTTLATAGTALLSLSFVFAGTAQEVLGSCIFLFVKHPFDVLDRVDIGKDQLIVKHISLLFTVFKHVGTQKLTQVPNMVLNTLWVQNVSRSEAMRERLSIYISFDTTLEDIQLLKNELHAFVTDKDNSRDFQPDIEVEITGIAAMDKMELQVEIRHKSNWSNETLRAARRSKFMCALVLALRKIPINAPGGGAPALGSEDRPNYSVAVSDQQAAGLRAAFDEAADAKRLFPTNKKKASESQSSPTLPPPSNSQAAASERNYDRGGRGSAISSAIAEEDDSTMRDSATPPPLRLRQAASESAALASLNTRRPAADTAIDHNDLIEPPTPRSLKSVTHSVSGAGNLPDLDREVSIEEVRGILRRQSTRGKRQPRTGGPASIIPSRTSGQSRSSRPSYTGSKYEHDPNMYAPPPPPPPANTGGSGGASTMPLSSLPDSNRVKPSRFPTVPQIHLPLEEGQGVNESSSSWLEPPSGSSPYLPRSESSDDPMISATDSKPFPRNPAQAMPSETPRTSPPKGYAALSSSRQAPAFGSDPRPAQAAGHVAGSAMAPASKIYSAPASSPPRNPAPPPNSQPQIPTAGATPNH